MEQEMPTLSEDAVKALYAVAYNSYNTGNYQDAASLFRLLVMQNRNHRAGWMGLGASLQMAKNYSEAIIAYSCAAVLKDNDPYVHFHAAECFRALNDTQKALEALNSALACAPKKELHDQLILLKDVWAQGENHG